MSTEASAAEVRMSSENKEKRASMVMTVWKIILSTNFLIVIWQLDSCSVFLDLNLSAKYTHLES